MGEQARAHHADLVHNQPAPEGHLLRGVGGRGLVEAVAVHADAAGLVDGVAPHVRGVRGLEGGHLEVDALPEAQHFLEELADELQRVGLAGAGRAVQLPHERLRALERGVLQPVLFRQQAVFDDDPLDHQAHGFALLGVHGLLDEARPVEPVPEQFGRDDVLRVHRRSALRAVEPDEVLGLRAGAARAGGAGRGEEAGRILDALDRLHASPLLPRDVSQVPAFLGAVAPDVLGEVVSRRWVLSSSLCQFSCSSSPASASLLPLTRVAMAFSRSSGSRRCSWSSAKSLSLLFVFQLVLAGQAVDEGVVRGVAPHLLGGEAVLRDPRAEGLAPAARVPRPQVADVRHLVRGVLDVAGPGPEEQQELLGILLVALASQGTEDHGHVGSLARRDDPVVPVLLRRASRAERHPVLAAALLDAVVLAGMEVFPRYSRLGFGQAALREQGVVVVVLSVVLGFARPGMTGHLTVIAPSELVDGQGLRLGVSASVPVHGPRLWAVHGLLCTDPAVCADFLALYRQGLSVYCGVQELEPVVQPARSVTGAVLTASAAVGSPRSAWSTRLAHSTAPLQTPRQKHSVIMRLAARPPT